MPRAARNLWTKYEDNAIIELVAVHGPKAWASVVKELVLLKPPVLRTGKQCRERYHNHLDPAVDKSPWTDLETAKLRDLQGVHGNKWAVIALELPGRTDNAIKNQWYSIARSDNKPPRKKRQPKPKAEWEKREKEKGKGKGKRKVKKRCGTADEAKKKKKKKKKNLKKSKKRKVKKRKRGAVNAQIAPSVELLPPNKRSRRNAQLSISPADVDGGPNSAGLQHDQALLGHVDTTPTSRSFLDQAHSAAMSASAAGIDSGALFGVAVGAMHAAASGGSARYRWMTSNNVQENPMRTQAALREMTASNRGGGDSSQVTPPFQGDCGSLSARSLFLPAFSFAVTRGRDCLLEPRRQLGFCFAGVDLASVKRQQRRERY